LEFKVLVTLWLAFNLQTLISINVSSLAVWGWIFSGILLSYGKEEVSSKSLSKANFEAKSTRTKFLTPVTCLICTILVGPLIGRDVMLANSFATNNIQQITQAVSTFPRDADQMAGVAIAYEKHGLSMESLLLAKSAISENPNSLRAWQVIFGSPVASRVEKDRAKKALGGLDPLFVVKSG
jgi:hypothetical protein